MLMLESIITKPLSLSHRALMKMDSDLLHSPAMSLAEEEEADMNDWKLPLAFMKKRHSEKIEGSKALAQSWRMKDRVSLCSAAKMLIIQHLSLSNTSVPSCGLRSKGLCCLAFL